MDTKSTPRTNYELVLGASALMIVAWLTSASSSGAVSFGTAIMSDTGQSLGSSISDHVALGDLDGDGDLDAFVANDDLQPNRVWLNDGTGAFVDSLQALGSRRTKSVALADVDEDGDLDAVVAHGEFGAAGPNQLWLNDGAAGFTNSGQVIGIHATSHIALADLDGDGDPDAFVSNGFSSAASGRANQVWLNDGTGVFVDSDQSLGDGNTNWAALADLDRDGDLDAFAANSTHPFNSVPPANRVWLNDGNGTFSPTAQMLGSSDSRAVDLRDLDGDRYPDAFVANGLGQPDRVWWNDGSGNFTDSGQALGSGSSTAVVLGDLDDNGHPDAFVAVTDQPNKVWLNDGSGVFSDTGQALGAAGSQSRGVALGDLDGDGDTDALVANRGFPGGAGNTVWRNTDVPDSDGDHLTDIVDLDPGMESSDFDDGTNFGSLLAGALPTGVTSVLPGPRLHLRGIGLGIREVGMCGLFELKLFDGSDVLLACGSLTAEIVNGPVELLLGGNDVASLPTGATLSVDIVGPGAFVIDNQSPAGTPPILVTFGGETIELEPGETATVPAQVQIDVKPGSTSNPINPFSSGLVPVALLGSASLDVFDVDPATLAFGPSGAGLAHPSGAQFEDVNGDTIIDLLGHFRTAETGVAAGDSEACLSGESFEAVPFHGCDSISTVARRGCGLGFEVALGLAPLAWLRRRRDVCKSG